ncbi:hypothetical protein NUACC26_088330 [Scytonema sp. NUACC26]
MLGFLPQPNLQNVKRYIFRNQAVKSQTGIVELGKPLRPYFPIYTYFQL